MIKNFINSVIQQMNVRGDKHRPYYDSWGDFLLEHRTIRLELPRQVGKTTALLQLFRQYESLLIMDNQMMVDHLVSADRLSKGELFDVLTPWTQDSDTPGLLVSRIKSEGRIIRCVLVDEPSIIKRKRKCDVLQLIQMLHLHNCLADDFFLVEVGTPMR